MQQKKAGGTSVPKKKTVNIDCLSKYIQQLSKMPNVQYFRGEGAVYPSRQSSALRNSNKNWDSDRPFPFMQMIDEFYRETAYKLDENKGDFIAFAQHHGIPTNLLDITTSPMTALYFACQGKEDVGVVYTLSSAYIDVTDLIHQYPNKNLIEEVFSNTIEELKLLIPLFEEYKSTYPKEFQSLLSELIACYLDCFDVSLLEEENAFYKKLKRKKFDVFECSYYLREANEEIKALPFGMCDDEVYFYLALQFVFLKKARSYNEPIFNLPFLPNMIYRPIMRFERGRNQQGLFMYQGYMTYIEPTYNFRVLAAQSLDFQNIELHIQNKKAILGELDRIGINRKTLFCDYDSIATYIVETMGGK